MNVSCQQLYCEQKPVSVCVIPTAPSPSASCISSVEHLSLGTKPKTTVAVSTTRLAKAVDPKQSGPLGDNPKLVDDLEMVSSLIVVLWACTKISNVVLYVNVRSLYAQIIGICDFA